MTRMVSALLLATATVFSGPAHPELQAAAADRAQFPLVDHGYYYYISTATSSENDRERVATALRLIVPSTSSQQILERCTPIQVEGTTLYRIDLRDLHWRWQDWHKLLACYPYSSPGVQLPLIVRADWLCVVLTDSHAYPEGYLPLLYGGQVPKTRDEFLKFWSVDNDPQLRFGLIEGESGVSVQRTRWIENRPISRGYAWGTRDVLKVDAKSDPLQHPTGDFAHDGEEHIVGMPKHSLATGTRGTLQAYLLANGQGKRVDRAPVDLVEDSSRFRGLAEIRTAGSCIQCHAAGINSPTRNEFRQLIVDGVDIYADKKTQEQIEAFHLSDIGKEIRRNNEDFAAIVQLATGVKPVEAVAAFKATIDTYDRDLTLADAARELYVTSRELTLALAYASAGNYDLGPRLAALAHGKAIPRTVWEADYKKAYEAVVLWRQQ